LTGEGRIGGQNSASLLARIQARIVVMKSVPLSEAKNLLSALVDEAGREHEIIRITKHGHTAAVLISEDDLESLRETVFWSSQAGVRDDIEAARRAQAEGTTTDADDLRARFGLPTT
jgi:antitoxin YefM